MIYCKYCKLIKASDEVPACGDVSSDEDCKCKDRKRVHQPSYVDVMRITCGLIGTWSFCNCLDKRLGD